MIRRCGGLSIQACTIAPGAVAARAPGEILAQQRELRGGAVQAVAEGEPASWSSRRLRAEARLAAGARRGRVHSQWPAAVVGALALIEASTELLGPLAMRLGGRGGCRERQGGDDEGGGSSHSYGFRRLAGPPKAGSCPRSGRFRQDSLRAVGLEHALRPPCRRVPGLAPRGGSRIRTGGDALAALVLGALAVSICSSIIAVLHSSLGADYQALGLVYLPAVIGVAFLFGLRAGVLTAIAASRHLRHRAAAARWLKTPDSRVWLLFAALLLSAAAVAELAPRERRRS